MVERPLIARSTCSGAIFTVTELNKLIRLRASEALTLLELMSEAKDGGAHDGGLFLGKHATIKGSL